MSTKSLFREALERRVATKGGPRKSFAFPVTKLLLVSGPISRPVDVARLLAKHGLPLKRARSVIDQLAIGQKVAVELHTDSPKTLASDLSQLGVTAYGALLPIPATKIGETRQINSSSAVSYFLALTPSGASLKAAP